MPPSSSFTTTARLLKPRTLHIPPHRTFSSSSPHLDTVPLAYTRHDPPPNSPSHPPILLLHGLFGSQRNNRTMSKVLAQSLHRQVYTLDLRNHGASPHNPIHTYTAMASDVESFITTHSLPPPILIGHSMGAKVAMTMALRSPKSYSALIPVDNAPVDAALKSDFGKYVAAMKEIEDVRPRIVKMSEADRILTRYEADMGIRQFLLTNLVKTPVPGEGDGSASASASASGNGSGNGKASTELRFRIPINTLSKALDAMADFPFKNPEDARYEGPTLMVRGTKSHYVPDETLPVIGRFFPRFEVLDCACGHWVMSEDFEGFRKGVVEWVRRAVDGDGDGDGEGGS